jgi:dTDP-4-amino-4,6-dideoxygalactose transaminase
VHALYFALENTGAAEVNMVRVRSFLSWLTRRGTAPFYDSSFGRLATERTLLQDLAGVLKSADVADQYRVVQDFEEEFTRRFGGRFARGLNSGTSALYLALKAVGAGEGREVITVGNTFVATITAALQTGAHCRFADVDPDSGMMDPGSVKTLLTEKTAAIVPVHMYGAMADMEEITRMASRHGVPVVEDACQAIGASQRGRYAGTWGTVGCFSFHATKLVGSPADGGMAVTDSESLHAAICRMAEPDWGSALQERQERMPSRLAPLSVPVLRACLASLEDSIERRRQQHLRYQRSLVGLHQARLLSPAPGVLSSWRNIILVFPGVEILVKLLRGKRLPARKIYPQSLALIDRIEAQGNRIPRTRELLARHVALPVGDRFGNGDIDAVIETIHKAHRLWQDQDEKAGVHPR